MPGLPLVFQLCIIIFVRVSHEGLYEPIPLNSDKTIWMVKAKMNWFNAYYSCLKHNSTLIGAEDSKENELIKVNVTTQYFLNIHRTLFDNSTFVTALGKIMPPITLNYSCYAMDNS